MDDEQERTSRLLLPPRREQSRAPRSEGRRLAPYDTRQRPDDVGNRFLVEGDDGSIRLADEGSSDPRLTAQGLALGMGTLARIMDRLNWIFGPVSGVAPRMSDVYEDVEATEVPPGGFDAEGRRSA